METPHVNPVGLVEVPDDYASQPRRFSRYSRLFASLLLLFFFAATVVTSTLSLGGYCLTSDGGDTRVLQEAVQQRSGTAPRRD